MHATEPKTPSLPRHSFPHHHGHYVVYAYDFFDENRVGTNKWHKISAETQKKDALLAAENLISSTDYQFVEIKKAKTEPATGRTSMVTVKTYNSDRKHKSCCVRNISWLCTLFAIGAAVGLMSVM